MEVSTGDDPVNCAVPTVFERDMSLLHAQAIVGGPQALRDRIERSVKQKGEGPIATVRHRMKLIQRLRGTTPRYFLSGPRELVNELLAHIEDHPASEMVTGPP